MKEFISGAELKQMFISAAALVDRNKQSINDLNVFPVPDGDTGTNMALTIGNAAKELQKASDTATVGKISEIAASALLRGARGNSGVITSLLFRGFSKSIKEKETANGADLAAALAEGVETAYKAVMKPAEGTILTVSRVSSEAAVEACAESESIEAILDVAIVSAKAALAETVNQNPVLKKAGVVDAGGMGYVYILEAFKAAMLGNPIEASEPSNAAEEQQVLVDMENFTFTYDTVYIVRKGENCDLKAYAEYLNTIGDSLVIGEDDEVFKVHVHTDVPGEALTEAAKHGTLELAKIENMRTQCEDIAAGKKAKSTDDLEAVEEELESAEPWNPESSGRKIAPPEKKYGVVSVCVGDGVAEMFRDLGVDQLVSGGQTMNPSTEDILKMVDATPSEVVLILPNNKNIFMAAEQCKPLSEKEVVVVPTATVPEGITAMLNLDPSATVEENLETMTEAIKGVTTMQVTYAARNSDFDGYAINEGDYLALCGKSLFGTDQDVNVLLRALAEKCRELDSEFLTIFYGEDITEEEAKTAEAIFAEICPDAEVTLLSGGQPVYYYLISAE
ncbi:MAG: DAK2 domain-containing protein [Oscillospiraceae bacterium]|nr:DAK2 domain-containing protein [Oscillospiraceae bacterium]